MAQSLYSGWDDIRGIVKMRMARGEGFLDDLMMFIFVT